jgi:hypothetical protein
MTLTKAMHNASQGRTTWTRLVSAWLFGLRIQLSRGLIALLFCASPWAGAIAQSDMHRALNERSEDLLFKKQEQGKTAGGAVRPEVSQALLKAQASLKEKRFQESLAQIALVDGLPNKSNEEIELIESTRGTAAMGIGDTERAVRSFSVLMDLPGLSSQYKQAVAETSGNLMWQNKRYAESASWIERYFAEGGTKPTLRVLLSKSFYLAAQYEKAAAAMRLVVQHADETGQVVPKDQLEILASSYAQTKNQAAYVGALERLVRAYPTPAYWADLLARVVNRADFNDRLRWSAYELQIATQSMGEEDYLYMAQLAAQQGYWIGAKNILARDSLVRANHDAAFLAEYDRFQSVVQARSKKMLDELPQLQAQALAASDGRKLFLVGATQLDLGQTDQGLESMERAMKLGGFTSSVDEYWLRLAAAYSSVNQRGRAVDVLQQVSRNSAVSELVRLWMMFLQPQTKPVP